jgi:flagellar biosynthesis chaperone FliJ
LSSAIELETIRTTQKMSEETARKQLKNMEQVVHENERRVRQKESDLNRLREKLVGLSSASNRLQQKGHQIRSSVNDQIDTSLIKEKGLLSVRDASSFGQAVQTAKMTFAPTPYREEKLPDLDSESALVQSDDSYDQELSDSRRQLEHLSHKIKVFENASLEKEELISKLKRMIADLRDEVDNLRSELDARPSAKQWAHAQQEIKELEEKLHDAMMLRKETNDIQFWKKHMSTRDKIRTDRRNFELGLWLIDSLPKTVLKESLQMVCRELNISEVSDIKPSLDKMKAVIHSIPRMENFIEQVCMFLFKRSKRTGHESLEKSLIAKPILEEVLPLLHRCVKPTRSFSSDILILVLISYFLIFQNHF